MKPKLMKTFWMSAMGIVVSLTLAAPCLPADIKRSEPQIRQTAPEIPAASPSLHKKTESKVPAARPSHPNSSLRMEGKTQGKLSTIGNRVRLRLNRSVTKVEVFAGHKKLKTLGVGTSFDITPYLPQASKKGLTFHYYWAEGQKGTQIVSPGEIQNISRKIQKAAGKPAPLSPPKPASVAKDSTPSSGLPSRSGTPALSKQVPPGANSAHIVETTASAATGIPKVNTAPAAMNITSPAQGDFMVEGDQFVLQWSGFGNVQEHCVNIYLRQAMRSEDNMTIAENVCVNGYQWQLPAGVHGTGFMIHIKTIDNALEDKSAPFSILSSQPDLRVTNFHIQQANPDMCDDITVVGVIQNSGHGTATGSQATVKLQSGDWTSNVEVVNIPTLVFGPNAHQPFSVTFPPPHSSPPNNRPTSFNISARVTVDSQGQVTEADEGNNQEQITFSLAPLTNLMPEIRDEVQTGMSKRVKIRFTVRNHSSVQVDPTICRSWIEKKGHENHNVPALGPGDTHVFTRSVFFATAGWRDYSLKVDYGDNIEEGYEDDNIKTGRIHARGLPPEEEANFPVVRSFLEFLKWW